MEIITELSLSIASFPYGHNNIFIFKQAKLRNDYFQSSGMEEAKMGMITRQRNSADRQSPIADHSRN
jgi:hypothetical protein